MRARRLILLLSLYVTLDLTNPFMPGAFNFDADNSIDAVRLHLETFRSRLVVVVTPPSIAEAELKCPVVARPSAEAPAVRDWSVSLRQRQSSSSEPPPSLEDH